MVAEHAMKGENLRNRTRKFGLAVVKFSNGQPDSILMRSARQQLVRSATSVGANYSEARRARSRREFISKVETALQELEESLYWLELIIGDGCPAMDSAKELEDEAKQLIALFAASARTAKRNERLGRNQRRS
jgi:four helix bundle protein